MKISHTPRWGALQHENVKVGGARVTDVNRLGDVIGQRMTAARRSAPTLGVLSGERWQKAQNT